MTYSPRLNEDAFQTFCEDRDLDPTETATLEAFREYEADLADDYAADRAEAAREDR